MGSFVSFVSLASACVEGPVEVESSMLSISFWVWAQNHCQGAVWPTVTGKGPLLCWAPGGLCLLLIRLECQHALWCGWQYSVCSAAVAESASSFSPQVNSRRNLLDFAEGIWREVCRGPKGFRDPREPSKAKASLVNGLLGSESKQGAFPPVRTTLHTGGWLYIYRFTC